MYVESSHLEYLHNRIQERITEVDLKAEGCISITQSKVNSFEGTIANLQHQVAQLKFYCVFVFGSCLATIVLYLLKA